MSVIVPRNTSIPIIKQKDYTTSHNNQTVIEFPIFQGERKLTKDNHKLGQFAIKGIKPEKEGEPRVSVEISINTNGMLNLKAIDKKNKDNQANIVIVNDKDRLTPEEIQLLVQEARMYDEQDKKQLEKIQAEMKGK